MEESPAIADSDHLKRLSIVGESQDYQRIVNQEEYIADCDSPITHPTVGLRGAPFGVDGDELGTLVSRYFAEIDHFFPLFSIDKLQQRLHHLSNDSVDIDPTWQVTVNAMLACTYQQQTVQNPANAPSGNEKADQHLQKALSLVDKILLSQPTVARIQALVSVVSCLQRQHQRPDDTLAPSILAVAIRMAFSLRLHHLDSITNLSFDDRMEQIRVFWCLYILDKELALSRNEPPLIDDDEMFVLQPKKVSDDRVGLVEALDNTGDAINLFAARQRLARIHSSIWKSLLTFKAQHQPLRLRAEAISRLNERLAQWKAEWFGYGSTTGFAERWPGQSILTIINLQFKYTLTLVKANPDTPTDASEVRDALQSSKGSTNTDQASVNPLIKPPTQCVEAARDTLRLATVVRKGGLAYLWLVPSTLCQGEASADMYMK